MNSERKNEGVGAAGTAWLELVGSADEGALREALGAGWRFRVWPHAALGDFILALSGDGAERVEAASARLRARGWQVFGRAGLPRSA